LIKPHYKLNEVQELIRKDNFDMYSTVYEGLFDLGFQRIDVKEYYLRHITIRDFDKQMWNKKYEGSKKSSPYLYCMIDVYKSLFKSKYIYTKFFIYYHSGRAHPNRPEELKKIQSLVIQSFKPDLSQWR